MRRSSRGITMPNKVFLHLSDGSRLCTGDKYVITDDNQLVYYDKDDMIAWCDDKLHSMTEQEIAETFSMEVREV
jgi:hypothetical protein